MKRMRIMGLSLVAVFAMAAVFAGTASAKGVLTLSTAAGPLAAGAPITASSSNLVFHTEAGNLECTSNVIEGTVSNNGAAKDLGSITSESSTGEIGFGSACNTTTPFGPAAVASSNLPWPDEFSAKGTNAVKKGAGKVAFTSTFILAEGASCTYESSKVSSTFVPGAAGSPVAVELTTTKQVFKINKKTSNPACPKTGELSGTWAVTSAGETVSSEL